MCTAFTKEFVFNYSLIYFVQKCTNHFSITYQCNAGCYHSTFFICD